MYLTDDLRKPMADQMLATFFSHRPKRMNRPHLRKSHHYDQVEIGSDKETVLNICFVTTQYRRRGIGRLLMDWGCSRADKLGLEAFVESTLDGKSLYEACGFVVVDTYTIDANLDPSTAEWQTLKQGILPEPQHCWIMWRPKGGKYVKGETKYSWEL
jgi:GNAT superfamily N-acetyltransferase